MTPQEKLFELQKLLLVSPQADKVYFNEAGDYQLFDHPEYQHQIVPREEVLGVDVEETVSIADTDEDPNTDEISELHTITQEDLDNNPDLATQGLRVGDKVGLEESEETTEETTPTPAPAAPTKAAKKK